MIEREATITGLQRLLADSYTLYLKTHNYHWNVTGPMFTTLHTLFETQYTEMALAVDEIAERIRTLGVRAPGSYVEFSQLAGVQDDDQPRKAEEMIRILVEDQARVAESARAVIRAAGQSEDDASADLGTRRLDVHEKNAWMLRSHLE